VLKPEGNIVSPLLAFRRRNTRTLGVKFITIKSTMKKIIYLFLLIFLSTSIYSQNKETITKLKALEKNANNVIITTTDTIDSAFKKMANIVLDKGFEIEKSDKDLYYLVTAFKSDPNYSFESRISLRLKKVGDTIQIILKGEVQNGGYKFEAVNSRFKTVISVGFAQLFEIAESYTNGYVTVVKRN